MAIASEQNDSLRRALIERRAQLAREIEEGARLRAAEAQHSEAGPDPGDAGDSSTEIEQADLRNAQIERDVLELRAIDAALERYEHGSYGMCTRCGRSIGAARLNANPAAERCIECQTAYERQFATGTPSSL